MMARNARSTRLHPALLALLAVTCALSVKAARLVDVKGMDEYKSQGSEYDTAMAEDGISLRHLLQSTPSPRKGPRRNGRYGSPNPSAHGLGPSPSYLSPDQAPTPPGYSGYYGAPVPTPRPSSPPAYLGYGGGATTSTGAYGGTTYTRTCAGAGATIKALPLDPKTPYLRVKLRSSDSSGGIDFEAAADLCEDVCISKKGCKAFYLRIDGKCYLMKGPGKIDGYPVDYTQPEYDTIRACQIERV